MNQTLEIYPKRKSKAMPKEQILLTSAAIPDHEKDLIIRFQSGIASTGSKEIRVAKLSSQVRHMALLCRKKGFNQGLAQLTQGQLENLIGFINLELDRSEATRADYRRAIKQFFKWYKDKDPRLQNPDLYSKDDDLRAKAKMCHDETLKLYDYIEKKVSGQYDREQADAKTIISDAEILEVITKGAASPRDKAFLSLLHESGCRASEFLNLKIGDLKFKQNYLEVHVPDGKTGKRTIFANRSIPYLLNYLAGHVGKDNEDCFLWLSDAQHNRNQPLLYIGGKKLISRCFERAKINKRHNWHWFRHSRATILAPDMTEAMLCLYMGWSTGSKQIKVYTHLCSKQLETVYLQIYGLRPQEEDKEKPVKCLCGTLNHHTQRYCYHCYRPLSVAVAIQDNDATLKVMTEETLQTMRFFMEMAKNPELMKQFEQFKKNQEEFRRGVSQ